MSVKCNIVKDGIHVTINTDSMTLAAVDLDDEYDHCINEMGFSYNDLMRMNIYAAHALFTDEDGKQNIIKELERCFR